ncbi:FAD-dependent oxidoreductase [Bordetella petrii]|nr:FAD-dependent oxidoreductase [Bordetella petrii]
MHTSDTPPARPADQADVIVCGGGLAGYCAALAALQEGHRVLMLEKLDEVGGSTLISGGAMAFAGTDEQLAAGISDSDALLLSDLQKVGGGRNDPLLLQAYAAAQLDTYRWLKQHGVRFHSVQLGGGQSVPRSNRVDTEQMIAALDNSARATGRFELRRNTQAQRLRHIGHDGGLELLVAEGAAPARPLRARHGIVLATGGFSRSEEWLGVFAPLQTRALRIGGRGNTGDGLRMGMALGANLRDMGYVRGTFGVHPSSGTEQRLLIHAIFKGGIAVNLDGRRFVDESVSYKISGDACLEQRDALAYQIFDAGIMALSVPGVTTSDFQDALASGHLVQADSIAALAGQLGIDAAALTATLDRYNRDVAQYGRDTEFGRDGLANHYGALCRIDTAPFYAYASTSAVLATYAGLAIDAQARVLDVYGDPIPGLYAAGEVTGGFHGAAYMTGSSLGKSAVFGRIAGHQAAAPRHES